MRNQPRHKGRRLWATFALFLLAACAATPQDVVKPEVRVVDLDLLESGLLVQRLLVTLLIRNPNDFSISLDGLKFDLEVNGRHFASGESDQRIELPRLGAVEAPVHASTTLIDIVNQMLIIGRKWGLDYRVTGAAYVAGLAGGPVPFEYSGSIKLGPGPAPNSPGRRNVRGGQVKTPPLATGSLRLDEKSGRRQAASPARTDSTQS